MNRKFTSEEIQHFYAKKAQNVGQDRKWIYNPYIHGDESEYYALINEYESKKPIHENPQILAKIHEENKKKIEAGEVIQEKPYNLRNFIDATGEKQGIRKLPLFTGWRALE